MHFVTLHESVVLKQDGFCMYFNAFFFFSSAVFNHFTYLVCFNPDKLMLIYSQNEFHSHYAMLLRLLLIQKKSNPCSIQRIFRDILIIYGKLGCFFKWGIGTVCPVYVI